MPKECAPPVEAEREVKYVERQEGEQVLPEGPLLHVVAHDLLPVPLKDSGFVEEHNPRLDDDHVEDVDSVAKVVERCPRQSAALRLVRAAEGEAQRDHPGVVEHHHGLQTEEERPEVALGVNGCNVNGIGILDMSSPTKVMADLSTYRVGA